MEPHLEDRPLLSGEEGNVESHDEHQRQKRSTLNKLILYFMAIHFLLAFCEIILVTPLIKLFEESLCLSYYNFPSSGVQERMCKISEIQRPLATIRGVSLIRDSSFLDIYLTSSHSHNSFLPLWAKFDSMFNSGNQRLILFQVFLQCFQI
jgi:hypothetical protein